ncbi:MAG: hypothetical protein EOO74_02565, partial [Myxococcales bacterium]
MLLLPALVLQSATVDLYRGVRLASPGYWAVEDTYLDKSEANQDHGGGFTLLGGDGRTVLIKFGDLARFVGPGQRVVSAKLLLTPSGGDTPILKGVTAVDSVWGEGPATSLSRILNTIETKPTDVKPKTAATRGAATWNERRAGIAGWPSAGNPGGMPVDAKGAQTEKAYEITGLAAAVQGWLDRPWSNHGLALSFGGNVEFFSSQAPSGRPRLVLTTEPVVTTLQTKPDLAVVAIVKDGARWNARVQNAGTATAPAAKATWWADGKPSPDITLDKSLAPGEETTVVYTGPEPTADPQVPTLGLALAPAAGDAHTWNDRLDVFTGAKPVDLKLAPGLDPQGVVKVWNETVAPQSRFSFAPEGAKVRARLASSLRDPSGAKNLVEALRQIGRQLGLPEVASSPVAGRGSEDLYPGLMGYGDTRFEGTIPGKLALPYEPYPDVPTETALLEPTDLLSASDVGRLNAPNDPFPMPKATLIRLTDLVGRSLAGLEVTLEQPGVPAVKMTTSSGGTLLLPSRGPDGPFGGLKPDLSNGTITLRATQHGISETAFIKAWRLSDAYRRSGSPAVLMDVRMNLPMLALESETDLAKEKAATDSAGSDAAKLAAITDGDDATSVALPDKPGSWVEIDLGRDRTLGEIALRPGEGPFWVRYDISVYSTGGKPEEALIWASEPNSVWARRNRAEAGWVSYRSPVQRIRYVRIVNRSGG